MKPCEAASHRRLCFVCTLLQSTRTARNPFPRIPPAKSEPQHHAKFVTQISRKTRDHATQNPQPTFDTIPRVLLTENSSARLSTPSTTLADHFPFLQSSLGMPTTITQQNPACPECGCKHTTRKGKRRNRLQILQVSRCAECLHRFTGEPGKNKTYPPKVILESISTFNLGYSLTETQRLLRQRFHHDIPARTTSSWLTE